MLRIPDIDQLPMGLIVRHLPARVQATPEDGIGGKSWRWEFRTAVSAMADATIVGFAAYRWDGERWLPRHPAGAFFTAGDFAEWYGAADGKLPAGTECADATNVCTGLELAAERVKWVYVADTGGRRVKGEAVVELLAELEEHANAPDTPAGRLAASAAQFRKTMLQHTGRELAHDAGSVLWLDNYVARNRELLKTNTGAFTAAGSWFGECVRQVFGGEWVAHVDGEQWGVRIDDKRTVFPFNRLYKHLLDERGGESLSALFKSLGPTAAAETPPPARPGSDEDAPARPPMAPPAPYQPPKAGWKFWKK